MEDLKRQVRAMEDRFERRLDRLAEEYKESKAELLKQLEARFENNEEAQRQFRELVNNEIDYVKKEIKEQDKRIDAHDTFQARIELMVTGLQGEWSKLQIDIQKVLQNQNGDEQTAKALDEIKKMLGNNATTSEESRKDLVSILQAVLKWSGVIIAGILSAKLYLG